MIAADGHGEGRQQKPDDGSFHRRAKMSPCRWSSLHVVKLAQ